MKVIRCRDTEVLTSILSDPLLRKVASNGVEPTRPYKFNKQFKHLLIIEDNGTVLGCFQYRHVTNLTVEGHINILPQYWGAKYGITATKLGFEWLRQHTKYTKVYTDVPLLCKQVIDLLRATGWKPCGQITNGCVYNGILTNVILWNYNLYQEHISL